MNKGKICVSVCAETADELIKQIKCAEDLADVIEIRFDCLHKSEIESALSNLPVINNLLATFRIKEQGGKRHLTLQERLTFWQKFFVLNKNRNFYADFESDSSYFLNHVKAKTILSHHFFNKVRSNLTDTFTTLARNSQVDIIKIAVQADDITDSIEIWKLLEKAKSENKEIIPIAMGEAGKWTRILGLAHGAFMTYAALESGKETASGQVSAQDLIEIYRVKELDEQTEVYGILGGNTSVSMSPYIHNTAFKFHNLNAVFVPLQVSDLDEFMRRMVKPETREVELNFKGFSVTIPHKQDIIKHLDFIDETAKKIGAVNTIKIIDGKLHGFNTDAPGFIEPLKNAFSDLRAAKVGVFGSGGAARACVYALKCEGAEVVILARNLEKAKLLAQEFSADFQLPLANYDSFDIVVNATPLGMKGANENDTPFTAEQIKNVRLAYDLVYVPHETRFLREAKGVGVPTVGGLAMLISQAMAQFKIWTQLDAPMEEMNRIALRKLQS